MELPILRKLIDKMFSVIKPKGVSDIEYKLDPLSIRDDDNEFYMSITYVVPDDSEYLRGPNNIRQSSIRDDVRIEWNRHIKKTIESYFDVKVIINSTGIRSESYHNKLKQYD
jgi:hypothetical protein